MKYKVVVKEFGTLVCCVTRSELATVLKGSPSENHFESFKNVYSELIVMRMFQ